MHWSGREEEAGCHPRVGDAFLQGCLKHRCVSCFTWLKGQDTLYHSLHCPHLFDPHFYCPLNDNRGFCAKVLFVAMISVSRGTRWTIWGRQESLILLSLEDKDSEGFAPRHTLNMWVSLLLPRIVLPHVLAHMFSSLKHNVIRQTNTQTEAWCRQGSQPLPGNLEQVAFCKRKRRYNSHSH